jgi:endonuclease/exonuclease/phosphatase family metal-dependent hydrolase
MDGAARQTLPAGMRPWKRVALLITLVFAAYATYRVFGVYTVRSGSCYFAEGDPLPERSYATADDRRYPRRPAALPQRPLRVMSFNAEGRAAMFDAGHIARVARVIRETDPDVVGLQEVHRGTWQARFRNQPSELAKLTGMEIAFAPSLRTLGGDYGNAILTKGKIVSTELYPLPTVGEPRALLEATIAIGGGEVRFFVTHLSAWGKLQSGSREEQLLCLAEHVKRSTLPFVLVGDLNAPPDSDEIRRFARSLDFELAGDPEAITHPLTRKRLDYIVVDRGWEIVETEVIDPSPSDHLPIIATLAWDRGR